MTLWMVRGGKYGEHEALALENNLACIIEQVPDRMWALVLEE